MIKKTFSCVAFSMMLVFTASCANTAQATIETPDQHDQVDHLEGFNRAMFEFNYNLDKYILKPLARGYRAITTQDIRNRVYSAFANLGEPVSAVNQVLQGDIKQSGITVSRFLINSTLGLAGTFDVATGWGLEGRNDGFEKTLATWGIHEGAYIVLPFIGGTTPRGLIGSTVDTLMSPVYWLTNEYEDGVYAYSAYIGVKSIVVREAVLDLGDDLERNSVDFYSTMRSTYIQNRKGWGPNCNIGSAAVSYDFDFDIEE